MIEHSFILVIALALGSILSQVPEFAQQYRQRLGDAIDELRRIILQFDEDALRSGYDRSAALRLMANNSERLVRDQANRMEETIARFSRLCEQEEAFRDGGRFVRLASFVKNFDRPLVQRTLEAYEPAVPLTMEGVLFACAGFFSAYILMSAMVELWRRRRRLRVYSRSSA